MFATATFVLAATALLASSGPADPRQSQQPATGLIYPASDAAKDIQAAVAAARRDGKHVLLDFGADWCPDCRVLGKVLEDATIAPFLAANFHVVHVDIGRRDKNGDVVAKYEATSGDWIPAIVVLDTEGAAVARTDDRVRITRRTAAPELLGLLQQWAPKRQWLELANATQHGVRVTLALEHDSLGSVWLAARFVPVVAGTHLYAAELPDRGINGLGRPTRLVVEAVPGLTVHAAAIADRPVEFDRIEELATTLPVYPPGAVTLRAPITLPADRSVTTAVAVSYMACGPNGCLTPVRDKRFVVSLPRK